MPDLIGLRIADPPQRWETLGFGVEGSAVALGGVRVELGVAGEGITSWAIEPPAAIDGLAAHVAEPAGAAAHPNGATGIDHVVVVTADFDGLSRGLSATGMPLRRTVGQAPKRMGFRRLGPAILELVEAAAATRPLFWGLVVVVADLDSLATRLGPLLGEIGPAVQPGRSIATLSAEAGLSTRVAFMDPELRSG